LLLNGGTWGGKAQSAQVFLECDESGSKVNNEKIDINGKWSDLTLVVG
jgi:hypothetical protein